MYGLGIPPPGVGGLIGSGRAYALSGALILAAVAAAGEAHAAFPAEHIDGGLFLHEGDEAPNACGIFFDTKAGTSVSLDASGLDVTLVLTGNNDIGRSNANLAFFEIKAVSTGKVVHVYNFSQEVSGTYSFFAPATVLAELSDEDNPEDDIYAVRGIKNSATLNNIAQDIVKRIVNTDVDLAEYRTFGSNAEDSWSVLTFGGMDTVVRNVGGTTTVQTDTVHPLATFVPCIMFGSTTLGPDAEDPVIILNHPGNIYTVAKDSTFEDPGAKCYDNQTSPQDITGIADPAISTAAVVDMEVDTHKLTYRCIDLVGNKAKTVTLNVFVREGADTEAPVVTILPPPGATRTGLNLNQGGTYVEHGATCHDAQDGDLPISHIRYFLSDNPTNVGWSNFLDTSIPQNWLVEYQCVDSAGNEADTSELRRVTVSATSSTSFLLGPNPLRIKNGTETSALPNLGIVCVKVGTSGIAAALPTIDTMSRERTSTVEYRCTDPSSLPPLTRTVEILDDDPVEMGGPSIRILDDVVQIVDKDINYHEFGAVCGDPEDGNLDVTTRYTGGVADGSPLPADSDVFYGQYSCVDSDGNAAQVSRTIQQDIKGPTFMFNIANFTKYEWGVALSSAMDAQNPEIGATCEDPSGLKDDMTDATRTSDDVDVNMIGNQTITFMCTDAKDNESVKSIIADVDDRTRPTVHPRVDPYMQVLNETYVPPVADCNDNRDGTGYAEVNAVGTVNVMEKGDYPVTYTCVDERRNSASMGGTVMVIDDRTAPVITPDNESVLLDTDDQYSPPLPPVADLPGATCVDNFPVTPVGDRVIPLEGTTLKPLPEKSFARTFVHSYLGVIDEPKVEFVGAMNATFTCRDNFGNTATNHTMITSSIDDPSIIPRKYVRADAGADPAFEDVVPVDELEPLELELGELYLEPGALCLHPDGEFGAPLAKNATVKGQRVDTTKLGEYEVIYECEFNGGTAAPVGRTVSVVEQTDLIRQLEAPVFTFDGREFTGSMRITQGPGAKFDEERIKCMSNPAIASITGPRELTPLITAAAFIDENPIRVPAARLGDGKPDLAVSNRMSQAEAGAILKVLDRTIQYGVPVGADVDLGEDGITVSEFLRQAPPGRYVAIYDCEDYDPMAGTSAARVSLDILIQSRVSDDDWKFNPTFGRTWAGNEQLVAGGFSFNGRTFTVSDNYHVDFERASASIGETNTVTMKAFSDWPLEEVILSLGVPDLSRVTDAEAEIKVRLGIEYRENLEYTIEDIIHEQEEGLVDPEGTAVAVSSTRCNSSTDAVCHEFTVQFRVTAPLKSDVMAISAMDIDRRITTTYVNDGVEFTGDPLLPAKTAQFSVKRGNQHPVETVRLVQEDRRYDVWTDQDGFAWLRNSYGSWFQLTHAGFERLQDPEVTVMTRIHDGFEDLLEAEREKARLVFDSGSIENTVGKSFSIDAPVKAERLTPELLDLLRSEEARAIQYLHSR
ncbi:MAG: hypothetical protein MPI95_01535 [Nitrosopumilus sp.]|nr:hypothetical protein [Nitrosopumilus sp.]